MSISLLSYLIPMANQGENTNGLGLDQVYICYKVPLSIESITNPIEHPLQEPAFWQEIIIMISHSTDRDISQLVRYVGTTDIACSDEGLKAFVEENKISVARQWLANGN